MALYVFWGVVPHRYSFAPVCGIVAGTFSSTFIASPNLVFRHGFMVSRHKEKGPAAPVPAPVQETVKRK